MAITKADAAGPVNNSSQIDILTVNCTSNPSIPISADILNSGEPPESLGQVLVMDDDDVTGRWC